VNQYIEIMGNHNSIEVKLTKEELLHIVAIKRTTEKKEKEEQRIQYLSNLNNLLSDVTKYAIHRIKLGDIQLVDNNIIVLFSIGGSCVTKTDIATYSKKCQVDVHDYALKYITQYIPSVKSIEITDIICKTNDQVGCYGQEFYIVISTN